MGKYWILLVLLASSVGLRAEGWITEGPPDIQSAEVQTIGGITYFNYVCKVPNCRRVNAGPISQSGTNFIQVIAQEQWTGICALCVDCFSIRTNSTVLGKLTNGNYQLQVWSPRQEEFGFPGSNQLWPLLFLSFAVDSASHSTLDSSAESNQLKVRVNGAPAAQYVLEASTNFVHWTAIVTNLGTNGFNAPLAGSNQFYRTLILPTPLQQLP